MFRVSECQHSDMRPTHQQPQLPHQQDAPVRSVSNNGSHFRIYFFLIQLSLLISLSSALAALQGRGAGAANSPFGMHRVEIFRPNRSRSLAYVQRFSQTSPRFEEEEEFLPPLEGLLNERAFESQRTLDQILSHLRKSLPSILTQPLVLQNARGIYDTNVELVGPKDEVLSSGLGELVSISQAIVAATSAAQTAQRALAGFQSAATAAAAATNPPDTKTNNLQVDCQLILLLQTPNDTISTCSTSTDTTIMDDTSVENANNVSPKICTSKILVRWKARPPPVSLAANQENIVVDGLSEFTLSSEGKVTRHRLVDVTLNQRNIITIGETLANLRRAVRSIPPDVITNSPLWGAFEDVRQALQQQQQTNDVDDSQVITQSPISVATNTSWMASPPSLFTVDDTFIADDDGDYRNATTTTTSSPPSTIIPVDMYTDDAAMDIQSPLIALPGSEDWKDYVSSHVMLVHLLNNGIPILAGLVAMDDSAAGTNSELKDNTESLFASNATLVGVDGKMVLLKGGPAIAGVYRTMSSFRRASNGEWKITSAKANWLERTLTIQWVATRTTTRTTRPTGSTKFNTAAAAASVARGARVVPSKMEGTDRFTLDRDGDIEIMEQLELVIVSSASSGSGSIRTKITDPEPIRSILRAVEKGGVSGPNDLMNDFLRRLSSNVAPKQQQTLSLRSSMGTSAARRASSATKTKTKNAVLLDRPPQLREEAATSVYNLMRTLHSELVNLSDPPGASFLDDNVELRGYMGEMLAKGKGPYTQVTSLVLGSLRGLEQTKLVFKESSPVPTIEFTSKGNLKVSLVILLRVNVSPNTNTNTNVNSNTSVNSKSEKGSALPPFFVDLVGSGGMPLKMELVSEYKLNKEGKIKEQRLIESRINGQLTPADVMTRWIRNLINPGTKGGEGAKAKNPLGDLPDLISLARSLGIGPNS